MSYNNNTLRKVCVKYIKIAIIIFNLNLCYIPNVCYTNTTEIKTLFQTKSEPMRGVYCRFVDVISTRYQAASSKWDKVVGGGGCIGLY